MQNLITNVGDSIARVQPKQVELRRVLACIEELCSSSGTGARIPAHRDLMRRFGASERTVLKALDEMQRSGRIVRRSGSGTYVSDRAVPIRRVPKTWTAERQGETIITIAVQDGSFFDKAVVKLEDLAEQSGLFVVSAFADSERRMRAMAPDISHPHGFIIFSGALFDIGLRLHNAGHRVVLVGKPAVSDSPFPVVYSDPEHAGYIAAKHLIDLGHEHFMYVHDDSEASHSPRLPGVHRAISEARQAGRKAELSLMHPDLYNPWVTDPMVLQRCFQASNGPTGVIAWNDTEAIAIINALKRASISVPEDVSVVGHDNLLAGEQSLPTLTTVDNSIDLQIKFALDFLLHDESLLPRSKAVIVPSLILRSSTSVSKSTMAKA